MQIIREDKNSKVLVITPLLHGHKISKDTKKTINRNDTPITWVLSEGNYNIPTNIQMGLDWYKEKQKLPKYILPLDRDIILGRNMIDRLYQVMRISPPNVAFVYSNFEFKGTINKKFPARPYDINALVFNNYISSNSMIRIDYLDAVGGFVTDDNYKRLLDWCMWLKFYQYGYVGMPSPMANFTAISTEEDISAGTIKDFELKRRRVLHDFVKPLMRKAKKEAQPYEPEPLDNVITL